MTESEIELAVQYGLMHVGRGFCCLRCARRGEQTCEVQDCKVPNRRQNLQVEV